MAIRPKTRRRRQAQAKTWFRYLLQRRGRRPIKEKFDEPGRMERLAKGQATPADKLQEQLRDRQEYRRVVLEQIANGMHGSRAERLNSRLVMVNAQIRELRRELEGGQQ